MAGNPLYGIMCKFVTCRPLVNWVSALVFFGSIRCVGIPIQMPSPDARCQWRNDTHVLLCRVPRYNVTSSYLGCFLCGPATLSHGFIRRLCSNGLLSQINAFWFLDILWQTHSNRDHRPRCGMASCRTSRWHMDCNPGKDYNRYCAWVYCGRFVCYHFAPMQVSHF